MEITFKAEAADRSARWALGSGQFGIDPALVSGRQMICCGEEVRPFRLEDG